MTEDRLLTAAEVAEILQVKEGWVREHTRNGDIPHKQLGRYVRYDRAEVLGWLAGRSAGGDRATRRSGRPLRAA
ncbi:MAG: helix-turn-helix domain-containing protein [Gaiellaceae bacterium]